MQPLNEILQERGANYGDFSSQAEISQAFKNLFYEKVRRYEKMTPAMKEAIEMIFHKIARIANGDPAYIESWRDITGYTQLVVDKLYTTDGATDGRVVPLHVKDGKLVDVGESK